MSASKITVLNYGVDVTPDNLPANIKEEDDRLISRGREIKDKMNLGKGVLIVSEVLHSEIPTFNNWIYKEEGLADSVKSFYTPQPTPFLMHHDDGSYGNSSVVSIGPTIHAEYIKRVTDHPMGRSAGYVKVVTFIADKTMLGDMKASDAIQSRRVISLSVGSSVNRSDKKCSICGLSVYDPECEHVPGRSYDGKVCYSDLFNPRFTEYSGVYDPANIIAAIRRMDQADSAKQREMLADAVDIATTRGYMNIYDDAKIYSLSGIPSTTKENTDMDLKDILKLESSEKLSEALDIVSKELKSRDAIIGQLSDTIKTLAAKTADTTSEGGSDETVPTESTTETGTAGTDTTAGDTVPATGDSGNTADTESGSTETVAKTVEEKLAEANAEIAALKEQIAGLKPEESSSDESAPETGSEESTTTEVTEETDPNAVTEPTGQNESASDSVARPNPTDIKAVIVGRRGFDSTSAKSLRHVIR